MADAWNGAAGAIRTHWPEYAIEALLLGVFMVAACGAAVVLESPAGWARRRISSDVTRRALMGGAMGLTAAALIYSPWGRRSGAHMNPAVTIAFWSLGKVCTADAAWYIVSQTIGGVAGVGLGRALFGRAVAAPEVRWVVTQPGRAGSRWAFVVEALMLFVLLLAVLFASNHASSAPWAGALAGALVAVYILICGPISGMSINPARTAASAAWARSWKSWWVYALGPVFGAIAAAAAFGGAWTPPVCAKLDHRTHARCIFKDCAYDTLAAGRHQTP